MFKSASFSLGVPVEKFKYSILEEKKGFFKKHAVISIDAIEGLNDEDIKKINEEDALEKNALKENVLKKILSEENKWNYRNSEW